LSACLLFSNFVFAVPSYGSSESQNQATAVPAAVPSLVDKKPLDTLTLTSSQLGWSGPFSFGVTRDSLNSYYADIKYTQKFSEQFALSGLFEYGSNMYRYGLTAGLKFLQNNLLKFSAERLSSVLPFDFDSGSINKRVAQNAYGVKYQHVFDGTILQGISFGGYYANAPSQWLDSVYFSLGGQSSVNDRRIAGSTSKGFDLASDLRISKLTTLTGRLYYDTVGYDTVLNNPKTINNDSSGLGGGIALNQLLGETVSFSLEGSVRKIYDTYKARVSWLPPYFSSLGLEVSLVGQKTVSHNDTPSGNSIGLSFSFNPGIIGAKKATYRLPSASTLSDVGIWTSVPVVHMDRVLVQAEQTTRVLTNPIVTVINPVVGPSSGGATVTITGNNLDKTTSVLFDGTAAKSVTAISANTVTCVTPPHYSGPVDVSINTLKGEAKASFFYVNDPKTTPVISSITPAIGSFAGGDEVTVKGVNFVKGAAVKIGSEEAIVKKVTADEILVITPEVKKVESGVVSSKADVIVTNNNGEVGKLVGGFVYTRSDIPVVIAVSPNSGNKFGNDAITIKGRGFTGATAVKFGTSNAVKYTVDSDTQITAIAPAKTAADADTVDITVATSKGTSVVSSGSHFVYVAAVAAALRVAAPTVTGVSPNAGPLAGGTNVTITGTGFVAGSTTVAFGGTAATNVQVLSPTSMTVDAPSGTGTVHVKVTTPGGTSGTVAADKFTYMSQPKITKISPTSGPLNTVTSVTITGTGFVVAQAPFTAVTFGSTPATNLSVKSPTKITVDAPSSATAGAVGVIVKTAGGTSNAVPFTYIPPPNITTVNPSKGHGHGGDTVVITGTNFTGATAVRFDVNNALSYIVNSDNQITAISPSHAKGIIDIVVTTPYGTSSIVPGDKYEYGGQYSITASVDASGSYGSISPSGITIVQEGETQTYTITADNYYSIADVLVDGISVGPVSSYVFNKVVDNHTIKATFISNYKPSYSDSNIVPSRPAITPTILSDMAPLLSTVSAPPATPSSKGVTGGDKVKIKLNKFVNPPTRVAFGKVPAKIITSSKKSITVIAPKHSKGRVNVTISNQKESVTLKNFFTYVAAPVRGNSKT